MKRIFAGLLVLPLLGLGGCTNGHDTAGGPGATNPSDKKPMYGQAANTFELTAPATSLTQGARKMITIGISRGTGFQEDVTLEFTDVPKGVSFDPASPVIKHGETDTKVTLAATPDSALGDFNVKVTGHPTKGANGTHAFKITVAQDPDMAAKVKRDEYVTEMNKQLADLDTRIAELKASAAKAEGQARKDLDKKVEAATAKRDVAAKKLAEVKDAAPGRWEMIKDGVGAAFDDLKNIFK